MTRIPYTVRVATASQAGLAPLLLALVGIVGCEGGNSPQNGARSEPPVASTAGGERGTEASGTSKTEQGARGAPPHTVGRDWAAIEVEVNRFCGDCHAVPRPESFPREAWKEEVDKGFEFYLQSRRSDLDVPSLADVVSFFQTRSPEQLEAPPPEPGPPSSWFTHQPIVAPPNRMLPSVSHLRWLPGDSGQPDSLLFADMRHGDVRRISAQGRDLRDHLIANLPNPAHIEPFDLDGDGKRDLLVSCLGSLLPEDHAKGQVVWLRKSDELDKYEPVVLLDGVGRVASTQCADFDGDGDPDILVAVFGWRTTGQILLLRQTAPVAGKLQFEKVEIDSRHGTIHLPVTDLNADGKLDFVALISQEHEVIDAFINHGDGTFEKQRVYAAGDPAYGSSGIQLVDMDRDSDLDILYSNGDTLDSKYIRPYHSLQWLENTGSFPYVRHLIGDLPGVYRALAADLDRDGDLDVAGVVYIAPTARTAATSDPAAYDAVVVFEQTAPHEFVRHSIAKLGDVGCMALEVGDIDHDGAVDLVTGNFASTQSPKQDWLTVWWNSGRAPAADGGHARLQKLQAVATQEVKNQ